jgi:hypothetical protein
MLDMRGSHIARRRLPSLVFIDFVLPAVPHAPWNHPSAPHTEDPVAGFLGEYP